MNNLPKKKLLILCIALGIFAGFFIKFFLIDIYHISGKSMEPTLKDGSKVAVSKIAYGLLIPFTQNFLIKWSEEKKQEIKYKNKELKRTIGKYCSEIDDNNIIVFFNEIDKGNLYFEDFFKMLGEYNVFERITEEKIKE